MEMQAWTQRTLQKLLKVAPLLPLLFLILFFFYPLANILRLGLGQTQLAQLLTPAATRTGVVTKGMYSVPETRP